MSGAVVSPNGTNGNVEGLHGVALGGPGAWGKKLPGTEPNGGNGPIATTQFTQAAGLGATWDPELIQRVAGEEGLEARYIFEHQDRGGVIVRAPNADLARDPRWGRTEESFGEDPFLTGKLAAAFVRGLQGSDAQHWQSISMMKHFMANSNEDNRRGSSSNFDERLLQEYYAAPFRMGIRDGHGDAIMASYNAVNGVPMTANPLLKSLLGSWGFNGLIATDRGAVTYMVENHHYFQDLTAAVAGAVHAGVNQFLNPYEDAMRTALAQKMITEAELDENLRGLVRVLLRAGAFDTPRAAGSGAELAPWTRESAKQLVLEETRESIVLLKNGAGKVEAPLLPLDRNALKSVAVLGPLARVVRADWYGGEPPFAVTPLEGIRSKLGAGVQVRYSADGREALENARTSDVAIVVIGSDPTCGAPFGKCPDPTEGKEAIDRKEIRLDDAQEALIEQTFKANPRTVVVLVTGYPYAIAWAQEHVPAIVEMSHSSEEEGAALADVLFGDYSPSGRLTMTWPKSETQLPPMMDYNLRDGRTYMYFHGEPLYAFGHGLSYTTFRYSGLRLDGTRLSASHPVTVEATVTNTGKREGAEVVQLYIQHIGSRIARAQKELKGFQRITLPPGGSTRVTFELTQQDVAYWDATAHGWKVENDSVRLLLGSASDEIHLEKMVSIQP
jgi:beta-glucosidase